jgi:hypothetical protein
MQGDSTREEYEDWSYTDALIRIAFRGGWEYGARERSVRTVLNGEQDGNQRGQHYFLESTYAVFRKSLMSTSLRSPASRATAGRKL